MCELIRIDAKPWERVCYACGAPAREKDRDHAPPQGFFPKGHRKDLITVPSCLKHNSGQSDEDEIVRNLVCLLASRDDLPTSGVEDVVLEKVHRGMRRQGARATEYLKHVRTDFPSARINRDALCAGMAKIARGIYYYIFRTPWTDGEVSAETPLLYTPELERNTAADALLRSFSRISPPRYGANPDVFEFQAMRSAELTAICLWFYGRVPFVAFEPDRMALRRTQLGVERLGIPAELLRPDVTPADRRRAQLERQLRCESTFDWEPVVLDEQWARAKSADRLIEGNL